MNFVPVIIGWLWLPVGRLSRCSNQRTSSSTRLVGVWTGFSAEDRGE
jgi:hypothetical protein